MTAAEYRNLLIDLDEQFSKDRLQNGWYPNVLQFYKSRETTLFDNGSVDDSTVQTIVGNLINNNKKTLTKPEMLAVSFSVLRSKEVFLQFVAFLPSYINTIFQALLYERALTREKVIGLTGEDVLKPGAVGDYWRPEIRKEFGVFNTVIDQSGYSYTRTPETTRVSLYLPPVLKKILVEYFPRPAGYTINEVVEPKGDAIVLFSAEESINIELPSLLTYFLQGNIKYSEKGRPNTPGLKKLQRAAHLAEFLPDSGIATMRSMLMAGLIYDYDAKRSSYSYTHELIRYLFRQHFVGRTSAPFLLTQLKGLNYFRPDEYNDDVSANIWGIFSKLNVGKWVTLENLYIYARTHGILLQPLSDNQLMNRVYFESDILRYSTRQYITHSYFNSMVNMPMLAGSAYLFGAFGLMGLSYNKTAPSGTFGRDWYSEYDGLYAVRLTELGAYVLGLRDSYEPLAPEEGNRLVPEDNSLMIRVEGNAEIAQIQLQNYAQKISDNRYQFSPALFLKDCKTKKDISNKIGLFKQSVRVELPPYWEDYLAKLVKNSKLVDEVTRMSVYRIPPEDKELQLLLVKDEVLKKIVIKAEQYYIMVEKSDLPAFRNRLREAGILLE